MDSLSAVEKEVDKALDLFSTFYEEMDVDIDHTIENAISSINDLMNSKSK
jgi:hypothetical protein